MPDPDTQTTPHSDDSCSDRGDQDSVCVCVHACYTYEVGTG